MLSIEKSCSHSLPLLFLWFPLMAGAFIPSRGVFKGIILDSASSLKLPYRLVRVPYAVYAPDSPVSVSPSHVLSGRFSFSYGWSVRHIAYADQIN